jgi:hypothetical protein
MRANIAELTEAYPQIAEDVFNRLDGALNKVLPGIKTPERYEEIGEVGLALVVGRDGFLSSYNPLHPRTPNVLSFMADNRLTHPDAWQPKETDEEIIGGVIPEGMGRFTAFALAKINAMAESENPTLSSHAVGISNQPGKVSYAGGIYIAHSLVGVSGLWEVHDHVTSGIFTDEMVKQSAGDFPFTRTADELAADIEPIFAKVTSLHEGVAADDLNRQQVGLLLDRIDEEIIPDYDGLDL